MIYTSFWPNWWWFPKMRKGISIESISHFGNYCPSQHPNLANIQIWIYFYVEPLFRPNSWTRNKRKWQNIKEIRKPSIAIWIEVLDVMPNPRFKIFGQIFLFLSSCLPFCIAIIYLFILSLVERSVWNNGFLCQTKMLFQQTAGSM